jgi:small subunit ribosomal protein S17
MDSTMETIQTQTQRGRRKVKIGKVVSAKKMDKTIIVAVERQVAHPLYKKYFKKTTKFMTHDAENACNEGDTVRIMETRPLSAHKRWRLVEVLERAK